MGKTLEHDASIEKKDLGSDVGSSIETDSAHEGLEFPTVDELTTLRRVQDDVPWNAYAIAFVELAERFSYYGSSIVFVNYIQQPLPSSTGADPNGQAGALDKGQQTATGLNTFYAFWSYFAPLIGALIADTYWGRYKTVCVSVGIAMLGHIIMIISSVPGIIGTDASFGVFVLSMIVTGFGAGMFKANISPLIAEQYRKTKLFIKVLPSGERVIVDPSLTISRIYMYFYLFINVGSLLGQIGMVYAEKYIGYWLAYTLPTIVFALCIPVLWWGNSRYRKSPPTGSVLAAALRLWRYAARGRWSLNPVKTMRNLKAADFWENAKPSHISPDERPRWMAFDDNWVDEVRRGFKACAVFLWYPLYWLAYNQLVSNLTSQAATMSTHGVPNDVLNNLDPLALIIFIPICDLFIYPALARAGIKFTALKKIAWGFFMAAAAMIWATVIQYYLYKTNPCGHAAATCVDAAGDPLVSPINVWAQTGSYVLIAFSEIFASITGLEYAFTKAPKNMRSLVMSIFLFQSAFASAIGEAFNPLAADPLLVWNYAVSAILSGVGGVFFWLSVRKLDKQEDELNNLADGHFDGEK
ncbi:PTR2-domain-containing protein [Coniophora puteana RWD-64-598 SS2]|uniref:PTR2-domain-containing protein n=1 Tax=Coniophora puteana (strain RWD-64-598) TaxID=741705 RepID=A0A5M3MR19_CONPW|nr:PTR2-domain-containing protein [Coniophora puteana RWD-64-598 SS2]EIW81520.1 PTR2-domain-containing protein [Coniophora puteana RWD-64-598 SS2]